MTTHNGRVDIGTTNKINFSQANNAGNPVAYLAESWGVNLYGDTTHPVKVANGAAFGYNLAGSSSYTAGNLLGFEIILDPGNSAPCSLYSPTDNSKPDHTFSDYIKINHATAGTIWIPYLPSAP